MYSENSNVLTKTGYNAAQLETATIAIRENAGFTADFYQAVVSVENQYGINALFVVAHGAVESAWGTKQIQPNNVLGFNADDANPAGDASEYASQGQCVEEVEAFIFNIYLTPPNGKEYNGIPIGRDYRGTTIHNVFENYSTSDTPANEAAGTAEDETIAGIMNNLASKIGAIPVPPPPTPVPKPSVSSSAAIYHVAPGDTLSGIVGKFPGTTVAQWVNDNKSKYPQITADFIESGWNLIIPADSGTGTSPADFAVYVTVAPGDTVSGLMSRYGSSRAQLKAWNIGKYPQWDSNSSGFIEAGWTGVRVK